MVSLGNYGYFTARLSPLQKRRPPLQGAPPFRPWPPRTSLPLMNLAVTLSFTPPVGGGNLITISTGIETKTYGFI